MQIDRPITIAIVLFVILLLVFFLVWPQYQSFVTLQSDLGEKTAEFNAQYGYYNTITNTYHDLQSHQDDIAKIDSALPATPDLGQLVYDLQEAAAGSGMLIKSLFVSQSAGGTNPVAGKVNDTDFSMQLTGDYPSLQNFLKALEQSSRIFEVTSISFGAGTTASSQPTQSQPVAQVYSFSLQIKTHSY